MEERAATLSWGLIGCGDIVRKRVAPALLSLHECDLAAVSRERGELAEECARELGARKWHADWHELVVDDEIDAVYIATPVYLHAEQTIAAARAGKHVLCEKPMALDLDACDRMIAACEENGVILGIAYYRRFYPLIERIRSILESGEIGDPVVVQMNAFERFDIPSDHPRHWFLEKAKSGGGPMADFGCHRIEIMLNLFGPIRRTESLVANTVFEREVEDTAIAAFEFERGGCGVLTVTHGAQVPQDALDISGTSGSIHVPVLNGDLLQIRNDEGKRAECHPRASNAHVPLIADFVEAVETGRRSTVDGSDGRAVDAVLREIYQQAG